MTQYNNKTPCRQKILLTFLSFSARPKVVGGTYTLTRQLAGGLYEAFQVDKHAWPFGNAEGIDYSVNPPNYTNAIMWPQSWWSQFDYSQPPYPPAWTRWPINARPQDFPDWPLFVDAFGENQTYWNPPPGTIIYRPSAVNRWARIKGNWSGSCFGFAISAFLAFDDKTAFLQEFPSVGNFNNLHDLTITDNRRKVINQLWIYQFGKEQQAHIVANRRKTPIQTLNEIKQMFLSTTRDDRILVFYNQTGSGGHAVNPYKVEKNQNNPNVEYIYIYGNYSAMPSIG
jgi:hypothetical protein